jgi:hypothetical protein
MSFRPLRICWWESKEQCWCSNISYNSLSSSLTLFQ